MVVCEGQERGREVSKKKYIPIAIATFIWIWPVLFIKFLWSYFDNYTQNFYRYLAAVAILMPVNLIFFRKQFVSSLKNIRQFILPALLVFTFQILWVQGVYLLEPAMAALIGKSSVLFVILLSFLFFSDERKVLSSRNFITGSIMAILGVAGVIIGKSGGQFGIFNHGVIFILLSAFFWALYLMLVKRIVSKTDVIVSVTIIFALALPLFFVASLLFGDISAVCKTPALANVILLASGIFCVGVANAFNYKSIKLIGTSISSNFVLITPLFTAVASYFIFGEVLSFLQIISGAVLVAGCILLLRAAS